MLKRFDPYLGLLLLGLAAVSIGVWNARMPMGDEGIHLLQAIAVRDSGSFSTSLYYELYALLLGHVTEDPINAHIIMRVLVNVASTLGLYALLTAFPRISRAAVLLTCLTWASSTFVNHYTQIGNINSFALAVLLPGLAVLLRQPNGFGLMCFILTGLWAAQVRPEYYAALVAGSVVGLVWMYVNRPIARNPLACIAVGLVLLGSVVGIHRAHVPQGSLNEYLLQGLGQCYADFYLKEHPEAHFEPMTEYYPLLNQVFGNPKTFWEAAANNPKEIARYLTLNGLRNLLHILPSMFGSKHIVKSVLVKLIFLAGAGLALHQWWRQRPNRTFILPALRWQQRVKVILVFSVAAGSAAGILLLITDQRYWITWVPICYLAFAYCADRVLETTWFTRYRRPLLAGILLTLSIPHMLWSPSNRAPIDALREAAKLVPGTPVIAGNFVAPYVSIAFMGHATAVNTYNGLSPATLKQKRYDIFVSTGLENTAQWAKEQAFLDKFKAHPETFGYRNLSTPDGTPSDIFVRIYPKQAL